MQSVFQCLLSAENQVRSHPRQSFGLVHILGCLITFAGIEASAWAEPRITAVANAASYSANAIAPGEMVVIFGSGMGPANLVSPEPKAAGILAASLANVIVTFNDIPSPLIYVSANQIVAMAPYELAGLSTASVQVTYSGAASQPFAVKLAATAPGIFSADATGAGNAAALNSDGSLNSGSRPAQPGAFVTFFATGAGQTTPRSADGAIVSGEASLDAPVTVTIGGVVAQVLYAGGAPGQVNGFAQVNVVVPSTLPYGGELPLLMQVGQATSQSGLTIAVEGPVPLSITSSFSPNSATISTSEGAPYGDCDFWAGAPICSGQTNFGYGPAQVVLLYICLSGESKLANCSQNPAVTGPLSPDMLTRINTGIAAYAGSGIRLIIRFIYNFGPIGPQSMDAPLNLILTHIDQLAPILLQNKDLIFALEAGFIGTWGEWHHSTYGNDTAAAHKAVLDKELSYFQGLFPILVRYPGDLIQYTGNTTPPAGLGLHDDYYASSADDGSTWATCDSAAGFCFSTYSASQLQAYAAELSATTMFAAEFGALYPPLQACDALDAYSKTYHLQSIDLFTFPANIGAELKNNGCAQEFFNRVGTRMVLERAQITGNLLPGAQISLTLTVTNDGYGRVIRQRPADLVLVQNGQTVARIPIPIQAFDLSTVQSFTSKTFQFAVSLPSTLQSGAISLALLIPDPAPSLSSLPAYALPLNSLDANGKPIFEPATGYNYIGGSASQLPFIPEPTGVAGVYDDSSAARND